MSRGRGREDYVEGQGEVAGWGAEGGDGRMGGRKVCVEGEGICPACLIFEAHPLCASACARERLARARACDHKLIMKLKKLNFDAKGQTM